MSSPTCELPPVGLRLPSAKAVMGDIPVGLSTSPSSVDTNHEQLTVWPFSVTFRALTNLIRKRIVHYAHEGNSVTVRTFMLCPSGDAHSIFRWF